jgi:hypothetical protein
MRRPARTILAIVLAISVLAIAATAAVASGGSSATPPRADGGSDGASLGGSSGTGTGSTGTGTGTGTTAPPVRACGTPHLQGDGPDGTVSIDVCDDLPPVPPEPHVVVPTPGMADVRPIPFDQVRVGSDGRTLQIDFVAGIEPCSVLDRVDVRAEADRVTITLYEGSDPSAGQVACIMIAEFKRVIVQLDQPLGDRAIVDGASPPGVREG